VEEKRQVTTSGGDRSQCCAEPVGGGCSPGTKQYFRATINIEVQMLSNCVFKNSQKALLKQKKDVAKSKHRFKSPNGAQRVEGHSYDCTLAV
jgi:hypothetical protein